MLRQCAPVQVYARRPAVCAGILLADLARMATLSLGTKQAAWGGRESGIFGGMLLSYGEHAELMQGRCNMRLFPAAVRHTPAGVWIST